MLGEKGLPLDELNRRGFVVTRPPGPKQVLNGFDYPTIWANPYLMLDDAKFDGSRFVDFPDETVEVVRAGTLYAIFGANHGGAFLVRIADGTVHFAQIYMGPTEVQFANANLRRFVQSHCFWQALIWEKRAFCLADRESVAAQDGGPQSNEAMAQRLRDFVGQVDPVALEDGSNYWPLLAFHHEDMGIMHYPFISYYMQHGRLRPP